MRAGVEGESAFGGEVVSERMKLRGSRIFGWEVACR